MLLEKATGADSPRAHSLCPSGSSMCSATYVPQWCCANCVQIMLSEPFVTNVEAKVFVAVASFSTQVTTALC